MVRENPPLPIERSHRGEGETQERWDLGYHSRARKNGDFLICRAIRMDLVSPNRIEKSELNSAFGYNSWEPAPNSRFRLEIRSDVFEKLLALIPDAIRKS
jgi:hypothetical protein